MRILLVTPIYPPDLGRLATYAKTVATHLSKHHTVTIVTYGNIPEAIPNVRIIPISKRVPAGLRVIAFTMRLWLSASQTDVLYVGDGASIGLPAWIVSRLRRIPLIRFVMQDEVYERFIHATHSDISHDAFLAAPMLNRKLRFIRWAQHFVLKASHRVLISTLFLKEVFTHVYGLTPPSITLLPYPPEALRHLPFVVERHAHQMFVTNRHLTEENCLSLLNAISTLSQSMPDLKVIFAKHASIPDALQQQIDATGITKRLEFRGTISSAEYSFLLKTSTLLMITEDAPTLTDDIYQAYEAATPVIAIESPNFSDVVEPNVSGLLVSLDDETSLTESLKRIFEDTIWRQHLASGTQEVLAAQASWEHHVNELTTCFQASTMPKTTL